MFFNEFTLFQTGGRSHYRIPSIIAANDGTVLAFCNNRLDTVIDHATESVLVCARKQPGQPWGEITEIDHIPNWGCMIGAAVYDRMTDTAFISEIRNPARNEFGKFTDAEIAEMEKEADRQASEIGINRGNIIFSSTDGGKTWTESPLNITPRNFTTTDGRKISIAGMCHGSAAGIQLKKGAHAGRLLCPSRIFTGRYSTWEDAILCCYNNSIYSDDHGKTWHASAPVQQGTGEGALFEDSQGAVQYNSRGMHRNQKRYLATSTDGGETYHDFREADFIFEEKSIGCNAALLRTEKSELPGLPGGAKSITIFANPRAENRSNMTICYSFDDGHTWAGTKSVWNGGCAYSSLTYDAVSRHFFLLYEKGAGAKDPYEYGISLIEFDLEWLLNKD